MSARPDFSEVNRRRSRYAPRALVPIQPATRETARGRISACSGSLRLEYLSRAAARAVRLDRNYSGVVVEEDIDCRMAPKPLRR